MKILITGGAGFLGANLGLRLLSEGHEVIAVDNMVTGNDFIIYPKLNAGGVERAKIFTAIQESLKKERLLIK